jgi:hypothetical protein
MDTRLRALRRARRIHANKMVFISPAAAGFVVQADFLQIEQQFEPAIPAEAKG